MIYLVTSSEKTLSLLVHVLAIFTSFIGPLIILLVKKKDSEFIRDHATTALNFQLSLLLYYLASTLLAFVLVGFIGFFVLPVLTIIFCIIAAVKANDGETYNYPMTIKFVK